MMHRMRFGKRVAVPVSLAAMALGGFWCFAQERQEQKSTMGWEIHDPKRPKPEVVTPGNPGTRERAGRAPSDAVVLFDGTDLSQWQGADAWKVEDGAMVVGKGSIRSKAEFGDCQMHIEWMAPDPPQGKGGQDRGNSGVMFPGGFEVQVLDSHGNETYADGQAAALYGQYPPMVNASRPPGQWQAYDIVFRRPRFDEAGKLLKPATVTVFHNGVLVQDHSELKGGTGHHRITPWRPNVTKGPIGLQDHSHPVRFRNIWVRDLEKQWKSYVAAPGYTAEAGGGAGAPVAAAAQDPVVVRFLDRLHAGMKDLNLSADQQTKVDALFADTRKQVAPLRGEEDREKLQVIFDEGRDKLFEILTDEQEQKLGEIHERVREELRQGQN